MASHSSFSFSIREHQPSVCLDLYNISLFKFSQFFANLKFCTWHLFCGYHYSVTFSHEVNSNDKPKNRLRVGFVASVDFVMLARDSRIISLKLAVFCVFNDPSEVMLQNFTCLYAAMLLNIWNTPVQLTVDARIILSPQFLVSCALEAGRNSLFEREWNRNT